MEKIFEQTLLYDFYGELLTEHQRNIYECAVYDDMSLGEIAQEQGISRQGVHDLIKRCDRILQDYESKLHLVERFVRAKEKVTEIEMLTLMDETPIDAADGNGIFSPTGEFDAGKEAACIDNAHRMERIRELSKELLKEF